MVLGIGAAQTAEAAARVTDVTITARSDGNGYVVRVGLSESVAAYSIPRRVGEHAVEWVLYDARLDPGYQSTDPKGPVASYTTERRDGHLVLRLRLDPRRPISADAYRDRASPDLLLNLEYEDGAPPVADASSADASPPVQTASTSASTESSPQAPEANASKTEAAPKNGGAAASEREPAAPNGAASASADPATARDGAPQEARERWKLDTVVIDPGHGGKDPGATANGYYEKTIVLSVAKKLGGYLEDKLDLNVVYTRDRDRFIALKERGRMANQAGAKLFISLHVNAARSRSAQGTETYFLGRHKSEAAQKVMERENSVIRFEENTERYERYDPQTLVVQELAQSMYMQKSEELAGLIQNQFTNRVHRKNRGVHQAGFYVLWSASMPSVLVELGFLTNPSEARFLASDRGQTYLASAIFRAVRSYKAQYEKGIETAARD
jgi:N-acetylmuramoyl-L-alanine amidase